MYVCVCKAVTEKQVRDAVEQGANSFRDVRQCLGVSTGCGRCASHARALVTTHCRELGAGSVALQSVA